MFAKVAGGSPQYLGSGWGGEGNKGAQEPREGCASPEEFQALGRTVTASSTGALLIGAQGEPRGAAPDGYGAREDLK